MRYVSRFSLVAACLVVGWLLRPEAPALLAAEENPVQWIWFDEGDPGLNAPAEARFFRRTFESPKAVDSAELEITADNSFTVWLNGVEVGRGDQWQQIYRFDVRRQLRQGKNIIAVEAANESPGPAALMVKLSYVPNGMPKTAVVSDGSWKTLKLPPKGWQALDFDDSKWKAPRVIGQLGKVGPWHVANAGGGGGPRKINVPEGFIVEEAVRKPSDRGPFSLVNLCFDAKGRLFLSQEGGPILLCVQPDKVGYYQRVVEYCKQVRNSQGMCWVGDALHLVGDGPQGTGLYRCRDTDNDDVVDEVKLLHKFQGGMGEHGPHAIVHGPDGWLYLVIGNHAWATPEKLAENSPLKRWPKGTQGPDQGQPGTTEDVLLPRLNDANGHAANIRAPGGTIWRLDLEGKNMSLVSAGYRNQFDAAFGPTGELFTFDSDMEWDEALPWYRAVRVSHSPPGSDFVWRTGAANTPNHYIDSLPPLVETGRGSPVGVEVYDHVAFPEKYRGMPFVCDWSLGIIYAVHLKREGASYRAEAEKFCTGSPLNVTDCAVGPDGALYFTTGGRGSQGGVHRIIHPEEDAKARAKGGLTPGLIGIRDQPQPLSAWGRASQRKIWDESPEAVKTTKATLILKDPMGSLEERLKILNCWQLQQPGPNLALLSELAQDKHPEMRAQAIWCIGVQRLKDGQKTLVKALADADALVRRRACEALVRAEIEPALAALGPVLVDKDRFVRTAARLVLQRIDPKQWADNLFTANRQELAREGIVALCKTGQAEAYGDRIFAKLHETSGGEEVSGLLDHLRTIQLALVHTTKRPGALRGIALDCMEMFPHKDAKVNRELAMLLTHFRREKILDEPVQRKLLDEMRRLKDDRAQSIHFFYCLRLLREGWDAREKLEYLTWYNETQKWTGGASFNGFLENIVKDWLPSLTTKDVQTVLEQFERLPRAATVVLTNAAAQQLPESPALAALCERLNGGTLPPAERQRAVVASINALGRRGTPEAMDLLRGFGDKHAAHVDLVARALTSGAARPENWDYMVRALSSSNKQVLFDLLTALKSSPLRPKADDGKPFRAVIQASARLDPPNRWRAVELLRAWTNDRQFGADKGDWRSELSAWSRWFTQAFPRETPLVDLIAEREPESKYKYKDLLEYLSKDGQTGDVTRGRAVFEKASCLKCHKFGNEGEGIGPDLTTVKNRFKRSDTLESLLDPSKVISDQYRSTTIVTKKGQQITGLAAPQGDTLTILQSDGTKMTLKKGEIDQQYAALVSVMPEKLLDQLTLREIADLFAFMESEPKK